MDASAFLYYIYSKLGLKTIDSSLFNPTAIEKLSDNPETAIAIMLLADFLKSNNQKTDGLFAEENNRALEYLQIWKSVIIAPEILKELQKIELSLRG